MLISLRHYFDKDVKESGQQERDHRATRGPRSSTPEPVPKRPRVSRSASKLPVRDSRRSDESRARATRGVIASATGTSKPRGSSMGRSAQIPALERSSDKETVTEGLLPAFERSSEEETATVVGTRGSELRTPAVER